MKQFYMTKRFWKEVKHAIPRKKSSRRPRKGAKKIMKALFYIVQTGIQWKALSQDFKVSASTVYKQFQKWIQDAVFQKTSANRRVSKKCEQDIDGLLKKPMVI